MVEQILKESGAKARGSRTAPLEVMVHPQSVEAPERIAR
jgi:hypothetical protein